MIDSFKKDNGITLLVLIITVIVMVILASISIGLIINSNGIFNRTYEAKDKATQVAEFDRGQVNDFKASLNYTEEPVTITYDYNYLPNDLLDNYAGESSSYNSNGGISSTEVIDESSAKHGKIFRFNMYNYQDRLNSNGTYIVVSTETGKKYTFSFYIRSNRSISMSLGHNNGGIVIKTINNEWQRVTGTFTATSGGDALRWYNNGEKWNDGDWFEIYSVEMSQLDSLNTETSVKTYNTKIGTLPTSTRTGYALDGWYTLPIGGTKITSDTRVPSTNTTYYAHWRKTY